MRVTPDSVLELRALVDEAVANISFQPLPPEVSTSFEEVVFQERWAVSHGLWWVWKGAATLASSQRSFEIDLVVGHEDNPTDVTDGSFWLVVIYRLRSRRNIPNVGWITDYSVRAPVAGIRVDTKAHSPLPIFWVQYNLKQAYALVLDALPAAEKAMQRLSPALPA